MNNSITKAWGFYFNCGIGKITDEEILCGINPLNYIKEVEAYLNLKPMYVGSCCGSSPDHTRAIKEKFSEIYRN